MYSLCRYRRIIGVLNRVVDIQLNTYPELLLLLTRSRAFKFQNSGPVQPRVLFTGGRSGPAEHMPGPGQLGPPNSCCVDVTVHLTQRQPAPHAHVTANKEQTFLKARVHDRVARVYRPIDSSVTTGHIAVRRRNANMRKPPIAKK